MNVAAVNPFDPPPGDVVREGRYAAFCRALAAEGHQVVWYSSDWSHALKVRRNAAAVQPACRDAGFRIELCPTRPYGRNVGLSRWRSHAALACAVPELLDRATPRADVVIVSTPPPNLAAAVARWAQARGVRLLVDIQDLWPETFARLLPKGLRWLNALAGRPMRRDVQAAYAAADACLAVAAAYAEHFRSVAGPAKPCHTLHLGVDLAEFDRHVAPPESLGEMVADILDKRWIFAGGSLGSALDWAFFLELAARLEARAAGVQLVVAGTGPAEAWLRGEVARRGLRNVSLLGQQSFAAFCSLAAAADWGLNHYRRDSFVFFPNRVFDYFAADLPVINTIGGELADVISAHEAGFTTTAFDVEAVVEYVLSGLERRPSRSSRSLPRRRRGAWVAEFDRPAIAARLGGILSQVTESRPGGRGESTE
ncbi:MAG: glycosyltransferase [Planctomycetota bacterium]|nr:glycosyltransferase [Planctomycetota bacterium]